MRLGSGEPFEALEESAEQGVWHGGEAFFVAGPEGEAAVVVEGCVCVGVCGEEGDVPAEGEGELEEADEVAAFVEEEEVSWMRVEEGGIAQGAAPLVVEGEVFRTGPGAELCDAGEAGGGFIDQEPGGQGAGDGERVGGLDGAKWSACDGGPA